MAADTEVMGLAAPIVATLGQSVCVAASTTAGAGSIGLADFFLWAAGMASASTAWVVGLAFRGGLILRLTLHLHGTHNHGVALVIRDIKGKTALGNMGWATRRWETRRWVTGAGQHGAGKHDAGKHGAGKHGAGKHGAG